VAYRNFPDDIVRKFIHYAKKNGCDIFRIFDAMNDLRNLRVPIEATLEEGGHAQGCISYAISPVHTVDLYVTQLLEMEKMGCQSVCIKDMAGMITPQWAWDIIKGYKDAGGKAPIDLHSHFTSGMTGMAYMKAIEAGVDILDTSMSPLSGGTGHMPTESVVQALRGTEFEMNYDIKLLMECREFFRKAWRKYRHLHRQSNIRTDPSVTVHQIPGGMLSNLVSQLEQQNAMDKYDQVLEETPRVQADFGYPPLVTPTSQIVGVQAVLNVLFGRYKVCPNETKEYLRGMYGKPVGEIKPETYEAVLGPKWKDEVIDCRPADLVKPEWDLRKSELNEMGLIKKEEDILTYALYPQPEVSIRFLKGEAVPEFTSEQLPLPIDHDYTRTMVKSYFPEHDQMWLEVEPPEARQVAGPAPIPTEFDVEVDGEPFEVKVTPTGGFIVAGCDASGAGGPAAPVGDVEGAIKAAMQGTILKIKVESGATVAEGDVVATIEAMKMEQEIKADHGGEVKEIFVAEGASVCAGDPIMQVL
jgi:pyruvate carboxylase subunit B